MCRVKRVGSFVDVFKMFYAVEYLKDFNCNLVLILTILYKVVYRLNSLVTTDFVTTLLYGYYASNVKSIFGVFTSNYVD